MSSWDYLGDKSSSHSRVGEDYKDGGGEHAWDSMASCNNQNRPQTSSFLSDKMAGFMI